MKMLFSTIIIASAISGTINKVSSMDADDQFRKMFSGDIKHLQMHIDSGNINVLSGSVDVARVDATPSTPDCITRMELVDDTLQIENIKAKGGCHCDYNVIVPRHTTVSIHTGSSDVDVSGLESKLSAHIGSGSLRAMGMGNVKIDGGNIDSSITDVDGDISVKTGSGSLRIGFGSIPDRARNILYESGSGKLEVSLPQNSIVKSTPSSSSFPYLSRFDSDFLLVDSGYNFCVQWSFGSGSVALKKNQ